jgi:hypothetical protein
MDSFHGYGVDVNSDTDAQTFGYTIYVKATRDSMSLRDQVTLLGHELTHVQQFERFGGSLSEFGYQYFKEYKKAGLDYRSNALEAEAYANQDQIGQAYDNMIAQKTTHQLRIVNNTGEQLTVYLQYLFTPTDGFYLVDPTHWVPNSAGDSLQYDFAPGENSRLADSNGATIETSTVRLWAVSASGKVWNQYKNADLILTGGDGNNDYTYTFNP